MVRIRYIVNDVAEAIKFYVSNLGFKIEQDFSPNMAIIKLGDLTLWLAGHKASATKPMTDGTIPSPGGWSRFVLAFDDLESIVSKLKDDGVKFKNDIVEGQEVNKFSARILPVTLLSFFNHQELGCKSI